jgi:hypothetical protein
MAQHVQAAASLVIRAGFPAKVTLGPAKVTLAVTLVTVSNGQKTGARAVRSMHGRKDGALVMTAAVARKV